MKEKFSELRQIARREPELDFQASVEILGKIREISVGKRTNIDRMRYIPLD